MGQGVGVGNMIQSRCKARVLLTFLKGRDMSSGLLVCSMLWALGRADIGRAVRQVSDYWGELLPLR